MAVVPNYSHIDFNYCGGDGCWHTPDGFFWIFDNTRTQELIPVSMIVGFFDNYAAERHKAAVNIQRVWRSWSCRDSLRCLKKKSTLVSFDEHILVRDEGDTPISDVHQEMKTFDGPNPQSVIFAEMVCSFFARKWRNEIQLLEQYGTEFVSENQDAFSLIFQKAMIQIIHGRKWGLWKDQTAVDPDQQNHLRLFTECSQAFRKAMVLIKLRNIPSRYRTPFSEAKCINVN